MQVQNSVGDENTRPAFRLRALKPSEFPVLSETYVHTVFSNSQNTIFSRSAIWSGTSPISRLLVRRPQPPEPGSEHGYYLCMTVDRIGFGY